MIKAKIQTDTNNKINDDIEEIDLSIENKSESMAYLTNKGKSSKHKGEKKGFLLCCF